ncbi:collagenase [Rheinheimera metallidurans]|uniref:collagenase n=1 Tax=Rheinheimera metallidurans TaxID=2925781 RepID=UPI00300289D8
MKIAASAILLLSCLLPVSTLSVASTAPNVEKTKPIPAATWQQPSRYTQQSFNSNIEQLTLLLSQQQNTSFVEKLDQPLQFFRYFSYYGDTSELNKQSLLKLHQFLEQLAQTAIFNTKTGWRLQEHYAVLLYRFYANPSLVSYWPNQSKALLPILQSPLSNELQQHYSWWEAIRSLAFTAYSARATTDLKQAISSNTELINTLLDLIPQNNDWQLDHIVWALAYIHILLDEPAQKQLDSQVLTALRQHTALKDNLYKQLFNHYLANSFRVREQCELDFAEHCLQPNITDALPLRHVCHDELVIRAKTISPSQLINSCQQMMAQEQHFHQLLATQHQPVANDFNNTLEVVIFDNYSDYNYYGGLYFNINTNNGGMYIEGTPADPDNQARFFSFQRYWQPSPFAVWNLEHEYIHYLDGRFVNYGPFGHTPSHSVWWAEGMAELLSQPTDNPQAIAMLHKTAASDLPSLEQIFASTYNDGVDMIYRWSYFAWRYLQQHKPDALKQLATLLKQDFFAGYLDALHKLEKTEQAGFKQFLLQIKQLPTNKPQHTSQPLGRYLYRRYLHPEHLIVNEAHFHLLHQTE